MKQRRKEGQDVSLGCSFVLTELGCTHCCFVPSLDSGSSSTVAELDIEGRTVKEKLIAGRCEGNRAPTPKFERSRPSPSFTESSLTSHLHPRSQREKQILSQLVSYSFSPYLSPAAVSPRSFGGRRRSHGRVRESTILPSPSLSSHALPSFVRLSQPARSWSRMQSILSSSESNLTGLHAPSSSKP